MRIAMILTSILAIIGCAGGEAIDTRAAAEKASQACAEGEADCEELPEGVTTKAAKLLADDCVDPALSEVKKGVKLMLCDGTIGEGTYEASAGGLPECSADGETACVATTSYKAVDMTKAVASNIKAGVTLAGVSGTLAASDTVACSSDGEEACVTTSDFKAAAISGLAAKVKAGETVAGVEGTIDLSNLSAANVKSGVTIADVTGTYPSASTPLAGADGTADLTSATFQAKIKSAASFEYFDSEGNRYTDTGDADIDAANIVTGTNIFGTAGSVSAGSDPDAWDLRYGVTVGSTTGKLKVNCRNMVDTATWDNSGGLAGAGADIFDTIEDYNNNGAYPSTNPWSGGEAHLCGANDPTDPNWVRVTTDPVTSGENSVFEDKITGLKWTRGDSTAAKDWDEVAGGVNNGALEYCDGLDHGGTSTWRLPTQKELMTAYSNGIYDLDDGNTTTNHLGNLGIVFWSSSTQSYSTGNAWYVSLDTGSTNANSKSNSISVLCVSP